MNLRRTAWVAAMVVGVARAALAQGAASPDKAAPPKPGTSEPAAGAPASDGTLTPPVLESGQTTITAEKRLTKKEEDKILADEDDIFKFASKDSGLAIHHDIKKVFISRDEVSRFLRKKFDEDKDTRRMERSELVLKKFGLVDRDFNLRPFLLSLLTEQIAGFYDNKTKTMNLLDWVPLDQQEPVMAHELTHALQDQRVNLTRWQDQEQEGVARNVAEDNKHIQTDETDTSREAVLEGQAMVTFADFTLRDTGHTLRDLPQLGDKLRENAGDMSDSPVLARAPLLLQQALLFPYGAGLGFEQAILVKDGTQRAFSGVLDAPPSSTFEILHPDAYLAHVQPTVMVFPDIHPALEKAGFTPYDIGVMGEFDVHVTAELFGGKPLADALAPNWNGGVYYAAQRKSATEAEKSTTASLAILYDSQWKNNDSARSFFHVFEAELPRQYDGLKRRKADEQDEDERVYSTPEGDVLLSVKDGRVWVSEGFNAALARQLRTQIESAQGIGPVRQAGLRLPSAPASSAARPHELLGGLTNWCGSFGMLKAGLSASASSHSSPRQPQPSSR